MRIVEQKGLGEKGEAQWLIKDLHEELKALGYPGGGNNSLIIKTSFHLLSHLKTKKTNFAL